MANIYGCDISHHQTEKAVKEIVADGKADFIITRAGIGSYTKDKKFDIFEADLKASGLKNSYYLASYAASREDAEAEADFLASVIGEKDNKPELAIFFDWEYFSANYIKEEFGIDTTPQLVQGVTEAFCERIKMHGFTAGVYLNKDYWDRFYTDFFFTQHPDYKIWYARPGYSRPDKPCDIWQYGSDNGADYGYTGGNLDKNILMGAYLEEVEPMKPLSDEPVRMRIGFASSGDLKKLTVKIEGLGISCEVADGYIITDYVSRGDQCYILVDANALGIPCEIYNPQPEGDKNPNENKETIDQLQSIISELEKTNAELERENARLKENVAGRDSVIRELDSRLEQCEKLNTEQHIEMTQAKADAEKLHVENGVLKETIVSLQKKVEAATKENEQLKRAVEDARNYVEENKQLKEGLQIAAPYMEKAVKLEMAIVEKDKTIEELKQQVKALQRDVRGAITCAEKCASLEKEKGVLKETIASLQEKVEAVTKENEQLKRAVEDARPYEGDGGADGKGNPSSTEPEHKEGLLTKILKILFGGA